MQKTLIIIKPDAVSRGLIGKVTERLETRGLKLVACKMSKLSEAILKDHYSHLADKPFFPEILKYMTYSPVVLQIWEGTDSVNIIRNTIGATDPAKAAVGTIRGDFSVSIAANIIHASETPEAAEQEIARFFKSDEIFDYKRSDEYVLYFK